MTRFHYRDPLLVWLLPAAYACHLLEEFFGGFPDWIAMVAGRPLTTSAFVAINTVAMGIFVLASHLATTRESRGWMAIALATVLFVNALAHILGTLVFGSYSPGLLTAVILYLPLSQLVLLRAWYQAGAATLRLGVLAGLALHALVVPVVLAATRP